MLFFGSERVCTETASEQPTGHSGLTSKAEEGLKVSRFQGFISSSLFAVHYLGQLAFQVFPGTPGDGAVVDVVIS